MTHQDSDIKIRQQSDLYTSGAGLHENTEHECTNDKTKDQRHEQENQTKTRADHDMHVTSLPTR